MNKILRGINTSKLILRIKQNGGLKQLINELAGRLDQVATTLESIERFLAKEG